MKHRAGLQKQRFNLIEIALAMGVIAVGLSAILGLFPIAMNSANESIGDNEMANIAETFLNNLQAQIEAEEKSDFSSGVVSTLQTAKPATTAILNDFTKIGNTTIYKSGIAGIFRINTNEWQDTGTESNLKDAFNEFDGAEIRVWKQTPSDLQDFYFDGEKLTSANLTALGRVFVTLFAEVSYPALRPYEQRAKRTFRLDVFNPRANFGE